MTLKNICVFFILLLLTFGAFAQPGGGGDPGGGEPVPISGLEVLLLGGAALGVSRIRKMTIKAK